MAEATHLLGVPVKHKPSDITPQGSGSGLNSDMVDGCHAGLLSNNVFKILAAIASGDIFYVDSTPQIARLPKGSDGQVLTLASGLPAWQAGGGGTIGKGIKYYLGTNQTIAGDGGAYTVQLDTKVFDDYNEFNTSTYKFTPTASGRYFIAFGCRFQGVGTEGDGANFIGQFQMSSSPYTVVLYACVFPRCTGTGKSPQITICGSANLTSGTSYILTVSQNTGSNETLSATEKFTWLMVFRLF
jgi:hypothetical protein